MNVLFENIPAQLIRLDRWVVWHYEERNGKLTKPRMFRQQEKSVMHSSISP